MGELTTLQTVVISAIPVLFAITVHEVAHGWVAKQLGDPTAMMLGRLTLNPLKHIDPIGTVIVPAILVMMGGFIFGWAKPVPVTWENLHHPKRDMALVAIAGPSANLMMAILWAIIMKLGILFAGSYAYLIVLIGDVGITINLILMILNLIPIPPLDGGRVLTGILPGPMAWQLSRIEPYGLFIILGLLISGILSWIMMAPVTSMRSVLYAIAGV